MLHRQMHRAAPFALLVLLGCATARAGGGEGRSFEQIQVASIPVANARLLGLLTSGRGNLIVTGMETDSLTVRYAVSAQSPAALFRNQVETIDKSDSLFVNIRPTAKSSIDLQVLMPEHLVVQLHDEERAVIFRNIENRVDVVLHGTGSLDFDDIEGPLTIQDGSGSIRIHDTRGPLVVVDEGGGVVIDDVKNSLRLETRSGDVTITNVRDDVTVTAGPGALTIRGVNGKVSYRKTGAGQITIEQVTGGVERLE